MRRSFNNLKMPLTRLLVIAAISTVCTASLQSDLRAQPMNFGSSDDPTEYIPGQWWLQQSHVDVMGGFSLIGAQWRGMANVSATLITEDVAARFAGSARAGVFGFRNSDVDELYDILRLVEFVKYSPRRARRFHLRAGPTNRMSLGKGHLVNFYQTTTSWDNRTIGAELGIRNRTVSVHAFTGDLFFDTISGGRIGFFPLSWSANRKLRSFQIGATAVRDFGPRYAPEERLTGFAGDLEFVAANIGEFLLSPYASYAWIDDFGSGLALGAQLGSDNFIDLARLNIRFGLQQNTDQFIGGYFGSFYPVSNLAASIIKTEDLSDEDSTGAVAGVNLFEAKKSTEFVTEIRVLFFGDFEFWYQFKRNFSNQSLSEYHLRLFYSTDRFRVTIGQDRGGLKGFFTLLNDLGDQTTLSFRTDYEINDLFWVFVRAQYTYEDRSSADESNYRYAVERRFEPMTGIRLTF